VKNCLLSGRSQLSVADRSLQIPTVACGTRMARRPELMPRPIRSRTPSALRSLATRDRSAGWHGKIGRSVVTAATDPTVLLRPGRRDASS
jgi:hypothetical protein